MARRRTDSFARDLRRYARAAHWDKVRALLEERLQQAPGDDEARQELLRLDQGLPLRAQESALERQRRQSREMREELAAELGLFHSHPGQMKAWDATLLRRRIKHVRSIRSVLGLQLSEERQQEVEAYLTALHAELRQRLRWKHRSLGLLGIPLALGLVGGIALFFHQRSLRLDDALSAALAADAPRAVEQAAQAADSGINRLVNPQLAYHIDQARAWLERARQRQAYLTAIIGGIESGRGSVAGLPRAHRADIERELRQLPRESRELAARWKKLCDRERAQLQQQVEAAREQFSAPLPPLPETGGKLPEDEALLRAQQQELGQRLREFTEAQEAYKLPPALMDASRSRLAELERQLADITAMRRTAAALPAARSYAQYRSLLEQYQPQAYAPALRMLSIIDQLPTEDELRDQMQDKNRKLPPGMLEAIRHALLGGGPSFTPSFHANAEQVSLMEEVFSSPTLRTLLYELSCEGEQSWLTESPPEVSHDRLRFSPSSFDSKHGLGTPRSITWDNPRLALIRPIDTTGLLPRLGIARDSFFRDANLPQVLDRLMQPREPQCPALAHAYIFSRLRDVMQAHEWPRMFGLPYAPTLRADLRSFSELEGQLGIVLEAGCWLTPSPARDAAEKACARWFREREGRAYAAEIARNFGRLVGIHPRFAGYIDAAGNARLCLPVPEGHLLWYIAAGGLTTTPQGEPLEEASPLSPVFIIEQD